MHLYKVLSIILFSTFSIISFSQNRITIDQIIKDKVVKEGSSNDLYFLCRKSTQKELATNESINSSAFKHAQFLDLSNNLFNVKARYLAKQDEVQILFNDEIFILYPHLVEAIQVKDKLFSPQLIDENDVQYYIYFEPDLLGKVSLYKKINQKGNTKKPSIYVKKMDGSTTNLKPKKKNVLSLLSDEQEKVERFVIESDLSYCNTEDLKKILTYYNTL